MYLDNTFSTPDEDFPTQNEAYEELKQKIVETKEHVKDSKFYIYCYTLGKEEVFINLARDLDTKIIINKERWKRLESIGIADGHFLLISEHN